MPYLPREVNEESVLFVVKPGKRYAAYQIAHNLHAPAKSITDLLSSMVSAGKLSKVRTGGKKNWTFCIPGTEHLWIERSAPEIDRSTVAQPRRYAVLTGEIRGYDAEIARRQQLAMMTRRAA